jgi:hypothetical protein
MQAKLMQAKKKAMYDLKNKLIRLGSTNPANLGPPDEMERLEMLMSESAHFSSRMIEKLEDLKRVIKNTASAIRSERYTDACVRLG